jgi:hypothetical protein
VEDRTNIRYDQHFSIILIDVKDQLVTTRGIIDRVIVPIS